MLSFKSKYSDLESLLKDKSYCKWLLTNKWFKHRPEFEIVKKSLEPKIIKDKVGTNYNDKFINMIALSHRQIRNDCTSKNYMFQNIFESFDDRKYIKDSTGYIYTINVTKYAFKRNIKLIKINLEELVKEAFKPSRVNYYLTLDPKDIKYVVDIL